MRFIMCILLVPPVVVASLVVLAVYGFSLKTLGIVVGLMAWQMMILLFLATSFGFSLRIFFGASHLEWRFSFYAVRR